MPKGKPYSDEFKQEALKLVNEQNMRPTMDIPLHALVVAGDSVVGSATGVLLHPTAPLVLALLVKDLRVLGTERLVTRSQIARTTHDTITLSIATSAFDELAAFDVLHGVWAEEAIAALLSAAQPSIQSDATRLRQRVLRWGSAVRGPMGPLGRLEACGVTPERGAITAVIARPRWPWAQRPIRYHVEQIELSDAQGLLVRPGTPIEAD